MSSSVDSIESVPHSRSTSSPMIAPRLAEAVLGRSASAISSPYWSSSSAVTPGSSHFGLPACARSSSCASQSFTISCWARSSASSSLLLGHLVRAGLDHRQAVLRADDDQVEVRRPPPSPAASG